MNNFIKKAYKTNILIVSLAIVIWDQGHDIFNIIDRNITCQVENVEKLTTRIQEVEDEIE